MWTCYRHPDEWEMAGASRGLGPPKAWDLGGREGTRLAGVGQQRYSLSCQELPPPLKVTFVGALGGVGTCCSSPLADGLRPL